MPLCMMLRVLLHVRVRAHVLWAQLHACGVWLRASSCQVFQAGHNCVFEVAYVWLMGDGVFPRGTAVPPRIVVTRLEPHTRVEAQCHTLSRAAGWSGPHDGALSDRCGAACAVERVVVRRHGGGVCAASLGQRSFARARPPRQ